MSDKKPLTVWEIHRTTARGDVIYTIVAEEVLINADSAWSNFSAHCPTGVRFYTGDQLVASFPDYDMVKSQGEAVMSEACESDKRTLRPRPSIPWHYYLDPDDAKTFEQAVRDANRLGGPFPMEKLVIHMAHTLDIFQKELNGETEPA